METANNLTEPNIMKYYQMYPSLTKMLALRTPTPPSTEKKLCF